MTASTLYQSISPDAPQYQNVGALSGIQFFHSNESLHLESGEQLSSYTLAYHTFGKLNEEKDNVIWIIHALTANSDPSDWWSGIIGQGKYIDPDQHFIICVNALGSVYGSTSPLSTNPITGKAYYHDFPLITPRDQVKAFDNLRQHLGIDHIKLLVGASLGGQQCLEWSIIRPDIIQNQLLIATNAVHSPWGIAFNESQRMAIRADQTWLDHHDDAGRKGMEAARAIALLSYRTYQGYTITQSETSTDKIENYKASSYQQYQGQKLSLRFNAFSYYTLTRTMDSHNIGRGRGRLADVLSSIKVKTYIIGIDSDILFPLSEQILLYTHINGSKLYTITSSFGHDGFLTENDKVGQIIRKIIV